MGSRLLCKAREVACVVKDALLLANPCNRDRGIVHWDVF